jgi:3-hydroxybutyryl-CoA dehydratase
MSLLPVKVGDAIQVSRTVTESDVSRFAEITGDFSPNHVNEEFMRNSVYGKRIAHGALVVGFMSSASSMLIAKFTSVNADRLPVSLGYDRIRFIAPVFIGDTLKIAYTITVLNEDRQRTTADILVTNQAGIKVAVAQHILKWVTTAQDGPSTGGL